MFSKNTSLNAGWRTKPWPKRRRTPAPPSRHGMERIYNSDNQFSNWKLEGGGGSPSAVRSLTPQACQVRQPSSLTWEAAWSSLASSTRSWTCPTTVIWTSISGQNTRPTLVWMIPKEGGRANVGLVTTDKKGAIKYLESFIQDTYLNGKPTVNPPWRAEGIKIRPFGGDSISGPRTATVGDGVVLVGDAAGFTSPLLKAARTSPFGRDELLGLDGAR